MKADCLRCPALAACRTQVVPPTPAREPRPILVVGEAPGADEDERGEGFVGRAGKTLDELLAAHGLIRGRDFALANVVRCRPPNNRPPTTQEKTNCIGFLAETIRSYAPSVILCVGKTPTNVLLGNGALWERIREAERHHHSATANSALIDERLGAALRGMPSAVAIVPMPHTSPLAFNRNAPNGEKWASVGRQQIATVATLYRESR